MITVHRICYLCNVSYALGEETKEKNPDRNIYDRLDKKDIGN